MSAIILMDEIVHYEVLGRGRPLLFLHGWVGSWRYWIPSMQAASIYSRAYALDLWGFGDTAKNPERYSLEQQVMLLDLFREKMGIGKIALVAHGLGAIVGLLYTSQNAFNVDRALLIGLPLKNNLLNPRLRSASPVELAEWLIGRNPFIEAARQEATKTDIRAIHRPLNDAQEINILLHATQINTPCLYVYGQNDPVIEAPDLEALSDIPEQTHHILFEQSSHFLMLDESSKFNRLLADFLTLNSGESPRQLQLKEEWKRRVR